MSYTKDENCVIWRVFGVCMKYLVEGWTFYSLCRFYIAASNLSANECYSEFCLQFYFVQHIAALRRRKLHKVCIDFPMAALHYMRHTYRSSWSITTATFRFDVHFMRALWNLELEGKILVTGEAAVTMNQNYNHVEWDQGFLVVKWIKWKFSVGWNSLQKNKMSCI